MKNLAAVALVVGSLLTAPIGTASSQGEACRFVLGFAALREQVGTEKVGRCLEDEHFNLENGNAEQLTAGGLLVWRKVDNFTAFTDGGTTWVNGPNGVESRPNSERFAWENDPIQPAQPTVAQPAASPVPAAPSVAASPQPASAPRVAASPAATAPTTAAAPVASPSSGGNRASPAGGPIGARNPNAGAAPVNPMTCPADQPIKGNQGDEWIYHTPLSSSYRATQPERCFATSAEAEAAGYRASAN